MRIGGVYGIVCGLIAGLMLASYNNVSDYITAKSTGLHYSRHEALQALGVYLICSIWGSLIGTVVGAVVGALQGIALAASGRKLATAAGDIGQLRRQCRIVSMSVSTTLLSAFCVYFVITEHAEPLNTGWLLILCLIIVIASGATWLAGSTFAAWYADRLASQTHI